MKSQMSVKQLATNAHLGAFVCITVYISEVQTRKTNGMISAEQVFKKTTSLLLNDWIFNDI